MNTATAIAHPEPTAMTATTLAPSAPASPRPDARRVWAALALWTAAALVLAASGALGSLPRPFIPLLIWSPIAAGVWSWRRGGALRSFVGAVDLRVLVLFHVVRVFFGAAFLVEMAAGRLSPEFARVAGPGDIAAGLLALPAALLATRPGRASRALVLAWNALGLIDILAVFLTAQRLLFVVGDARLLATFGRLPYAALPVLVVPLVLLTHLAVFARLRAPR